MRPRCCLRNLTFLGIIMAVYLLTGSRRSPRVSWAACSPKRASLRAFRAGLPASRTAAAAPSTAAESEPTDAEPGAADPKAAPAWQGRQAGMPKAHAVRDRGAGRLDHRGRRVHDGRHGHGAARARAAIRRGAWWYREFLPCT